MLLGFPSPFCGQSQGHKAGDRLVLLATPLPLPLPLSCTSLTCSGFLLAVKSSNQLHIHVIATFTVPHLPPLA